MHGSGSRDAGELLTSHTRTERREIDVAAMRGRVCIVMFLQSLLYHGLPDRWSEG